MGWKLAEEVAWARPDRPGPEWWTLMDIAQDAKDEKRQSMCGYEYLMARGKCSRATLGRRLKALTDQKLISVVRHSAPGVRAIYKVSDDLTTGLTIAETRTGLTIAETRTGLTIAETRTGLTIAETRTGVLPDATCLIPSVNGSQKRPEHVSPFVSHTPSGTPSYNPVNTPTPVVPPSVEVPEPAELDGASRQPIEQQAWLALHSRM